MFNLLKGPYKETLKPKINLFIALAPLVTLKESYLTWPVKFYMSHLDWFEWLGNVFGMYEVGGSIWWNEFGRFTCALSDTLCLYGETWLYTWNSDHEEPYRY